MGKDMSRRSKFLLITLLLYAAYHLSNPRVSEAARNQQGSAPTNKLQNPPAPQGAKASKPPVKKKTLLVTLRLQGLSAAELVKLVSERGVDFQLTEKDAGELRSAGASPALINAVRENVRLFIDNAVRIRIYADSSLADYSAYRSGSRFYVVMPKKNFSNLGRAVWASPEFGAADMQWLQLDPNMVFSILLPQEVMARVEQSEGQLDVILVRRISK